MKKNLLEKLNSLPCKIVWKGVDYGLFIYRDSLWGVAYARGKYFCDRPKCIDIDEENIMLTDVSDSSLESAIDIISERIERIAEQEKDMSFIK